jgi:two-component system response regulator VicR
LGRFDDVPGCIGIACAGADPIVHSGCKRWDQRLVARKIAYGKLETVFPRDEVSMGSDQKLIVCIEDEPDMIELLRTILESNGYRVIGATGGAAGLETVQREKPDLIMLDLMMPDMDGWEVFQQIKDDSDLVNIPIVVVTAKAQSIDKVLGLYIARAEDYITKPFKVQDLVDRIDSLVGKSA